jgi:hypothetical protein
MEEESYTVPICRCARCTEARERDRQDEIVVPLETLLLEAKAGRIKSFAFTAIRQNDYIHVGYEEGKGSMLELLGAVCLLKEHVRKGYS